MKDASHRTIWLTALGCLALVAACDGSDPQDGKDVLGFDLPVVPDAGSETGGGDLGPDVETAAGAICPAGQVTLTFVVDDTANQTYGPGELIWTGSFSFDEATNQVVYATSWLPEEGPYPQLYDDGPVSAGGHEPEGATADDHIWGVAVCYNADQDRLFAYGVLNEEFRWIWVGPNGTFEVPYGASGLMEVPGMTIGAHGEVDFKLFLDVATLHDDYIDLDFTKFRVFVKGTMNSWTPIQLLDDGFAPDEVADDKVYTYQQSAFLGKHDGLLQPGQEAQFVYVFAMQEVDPDDGMEYKADGDAVPDGVSASAACTPGGAFEPIAVELSLDSKGIAFNTAVVVCDGETPPECSDANPCPSADEECVEGVCVPKTPECSDTNPCPSADEECVEGVCVPKTPECSDTNPCADPTDECVDGTCVPAAPAPELFLVLPSSGPTTGGNEVTLSGANFVDGLSVTFGTEEATIQTVVPETITVTAPAHAAGQVDVTVTNPDLKSTTYPDGYTYVEAANAPVIESIDPSTGPTAGGTSVTISGSNFLAGATVLFGTGTGAVDSVTESSIVVVTPAHPAGTVNVSVTNPDSQQGTLTDGFTYEEGTLTWGQLEGPAAQDSKVGKQLLIKAQAYEGGVTDSPGAGFGLSAEVGYGTVGTDPSADPGAWTWVSAEYQSDVGSNDVWGATISPDEGSYAVVERFSLNGGTSWLYADLDGSDNGFDHAAQLITLTVAPAGSVLAASVDPTSASPIGGGEVTLTGTGFADTCTVTLDGEALATATFVDPTTFTFTAPPHPAGAVSVEVTCGADSDSIAFDYVAQWDGVLDEWLPAHSLATNGVATDWGAQNVLDELFVETDGENLYLAIAGQALGDSVPNALVAYVDVDSGAATGVADMTTITDTTGAVDNPLGGALLVTATDFGAELAFASVDGDSYDPVADGGDPAAKAAGWRHLTKGTLDDLFWQLDGAVFATSAGVEAWIPLATLFDGPPTGADRTIAIFARVTNSDGLFFANQALPEGVAGTASEEQTAVSTFTLTY